MKFEVTRTLYDDRGGEFVLTATAEIITYEEPRLWGHPDRRHPGCIEVEVVEFLKLEDPNVEGDVTEGNKAIRKRLKKEGFHIPDVDDRLLEDVNVDEVIRDHHDSRF